MRSDTAGAELFTSQVHRLSDKTPPSFGHQFRLMYFKWREIEDTNYQLKITKVKCAKSKNATATCIPPPVTVGFVPNPNVGANAICPFPVGFGGPILMFIGLPPL